MEVVIDTGAGLCIITQSCLNKIGKEIDQESNTQLIDINGNGTRPLGVVKNVLITLNGRLPAYMDMVVMKATNYDVILGNDWLRKIEATIDFKNKKLQAKLGHESLRHPIVFEKEVKKVTFEGDDDYEDEELTSASAYLLKTVGEKEATAAERENIEDLQWKEEWREIPAYRTEEQTHLTEEQEQQLNTLLNRNRDRFADNLLALGHVKDYEHQIPTECSRPIKQKPYRYDPEKRDFIQKETKKMIDAGIAKESSSAWTSPVVVVKKKNGNFRLCVDYRKLNQVTERDEYPLPLINDIFDTMTGAQWFTTLDCMSGYWQMKVADEDQSKTAYITEDGLYEFTVMPFGLSNAPASFQRMMDRVFKDYKGKFVSVYLDDITIYSKTFKDHLQHLQLVFNRLREVDLKLGEEKCEFAKTELCLLGHRIGREGRKPDPAKVEVVRNWPTPQTVKDIRSFLGLASYYRKFIPNFSIIAKPMFRLIQKDVPFEWTSACRMAFEKLKDSLVNAPILRHPNFDKPFILYTDGSYDGLGAVLSQKDENDQEVVIAYASKTIVGAQEKYGATELEMLAIRWAVEQFHVYLLGKPFTIITDHLALKFPFKKMILNSRMNKWILYLQQFSYQIEYKPGRAHKNVDALSRRPPCLKTGTSI